MFYKIHGVRALIYHQHKLLILRRASSDKADSELWDVPGGAIEPREDPRTALKREVLEETGLSGTVFTIKDPYGLIVDDFRKGKLVILVFSCFSETAKVNLNAEHDSYRWEKISNISAYPVGRILRDLLPSFKATKTA